MVTWTLVIVVMVGISGRSGVGVGSVPGFADQPECQRAGETVKMVVGGNLREVRYICVVQTKEAVAAKPSGG